MQTLSELFVLNDAPLICILHTFQIEGNRNTGIPTTEQDFLVWLFWSGTF